MKKTRIKYLLKSIRKNLVSFIAVAFIAATSIAVFLGLQSVAEAILDRANEYFISNELESMEITCAYGLTEEDIETISEWDGVDVAEGGYATTVLMDTETEVLALQVLSLCAEMNTPVVIEGTLPSASDEVAVEETLAKKEGIQIGDELTLAHNGELAADTFTVTAIINQPAYSCADYMDSRGQSTQGTGSVAYYVAVSTEAFSDLYYRGRYTKVYIKNDALDELYYFSEEYRKQEAALIEQFEEAGEEDWIISGRSEVGDVRGIQTTVKGIYGVSYAISFIFLLVAAVVCYTAITRMINEQRTLIGAQKALGFAPKEILAHYMSYNVLCVILGILAGYVLMAVVESIVLSVFTKDFLMGSIPMTFAWKYALAVSAVCLLVFIAAVWIACAKLVRQPATVLLRGELPSQGKHHFFEKWKGFQRLSLYSRTIIKNVVGDRSRTMTTIVGVVGCVSLLIVCFSMRFSIGSSTNVQFKKYFFYDDRLIVDSSAGTAEEFEAVLQEDGISYMAVQEKVKYFRTEGEDWEAVHIVTTSDFEELADYMYLEDIETKEAAEIPEDGLLVSEKCAEVYGLSEGSTLELMDSEGKARECQVVGIIAHYLPYHMFVTTDSYYESVLDTEADASVYLLKGDAGGFMNRFAILMDSCP